MKIIQLIILAATIILVGCKTSPANSNGVADTSVVTINKKDASKVVPYNGLAQVKATDKIKNGKTTRTYDITPEKGGLFGFMTVWDFLRWTGGILILLGIVGLAMRLVLPWPWFINAYAAGAGAATVAIANWLEAYINLLGWILCLIGIIAGVHWIFHHKSTIQKIENRVEGGLKNLLDSTMQKQDAKGTEPKQ